MLVAALLLGFAFPEATRPDPLPDEAGCDHYTGTSSGNDPSVQFDVVLCPHQDGTEGKVQGQVQWSSLLSGWNLRKVEGSWSGASLKLKDLEIVEERPEPGFRFCTIDSYDLDEKDGGQLEGTYDSGDCNDHATVTLTPSASPPTGDTPEAPEPDPQTQPKPKPKPEPKPKPKPGEASGGCGCDLTMLLAPLFLLGLRRRREH